jgi:hypothetical protein
MPEDKATACLHVLDDSFRQVAVNTFIKNNLLAEWFLAETVVANEIRPQDFPTSLLDFTECDDKTVRDGLSLQAVKPTHEQEEELMVIFHAMLEKAKETKEMLTNRPKLTSFKHFLVNPVKGNYIMPHSRDLVHAYFIILLVIYSFILCTNTRFSKCV